MLNTFNMKKKKRIKVCPRGNEGETSNGEEVMGTLVFLFGQYCEKKKRKIMVNNINRLLYYLQCLQYFLLNNLIVKLLNQ